MAGSADLLDQIRAAVSNGQADATAAAVRAALRDGMGAPLVLQQGLIAAMDEVGRLFEEGELFMPEMMVAARAMKGGMGQLGPLLAQGGGRSLGRVAIGTVKGDLHDVGKSLVAMMLEGAGFTVLDLGIDVPPQGFVDAARQGARIVALSGLLTSVLGQMEATVAALGAAGVRDQVRVLVGGAPVTEAFADAIGADGYAADAPGAVRRARELVADARVRTAARRSSNGPDQPGATPNRPRRVTSRTEPPPESMSSRQRLLAALERRVPDRLPVTTHHVLPCYLEQHLPGADAAAFFDRFGLDAICWVEPCMAPAAGPTWRQRSEQLTHPSYRTTRHSFETPGGTLSTTVQADRHTAWITDPLIKQPSDIDLLGAHWPAPTCDVAAVKRAAASLGQRGIVRSHICGFEIEGQPGCWQDAACLVGLEPLIYATYDDPQWVHRLLELLQQRKLHHARSMAGAALDLVELGGGAASSTVISPRLFDRFVAPYDAPIIAALHEAGQRVVYHTCGGMMPILERIADMGPDAMETFTPPAMGGDADLARAKQRIGDRVCIIGGFDQAHHLLGCSPEQTRAAVRRCFAAAGADGGYILSPSDHFFEAADELLAAFADEARRCCYGSR